MLASRIARLATRLGLVLPQSLDKVHLSLVGCVRLDGNVPLVFTEDARRWASALGADVVSGLNATDVWASVEFRGQPASANDLLRLRTGDVPQRVTVTLATTHLLVRCECADAALRVIHVEQPGRRLPALLAARFVEGSEASFRPAALVAALHAKQELESSDIRSSLIRADEADVQWLSAYRRSLKETSAWMDETSPEVFYAVASRQPLRLLRSGGEWPRSFTYPQARVELPTARGTRSFEIESVDDNLEVLSFGVDDPEETVLPSGKARVKPNTQPIKRMTEALAGLADAAWLEHVTLLDVLRRPRSLPAFEAMPFSPVEIGARGDENARQHDAVAMALGSPDVSLVHGPPGTGKTTVICELIRQLIRAGKRVLLVAPTHVALDNVLERIGDRPGVVALRLGHRDNVDERVHGYMVHERAASLRASLLRSLEAATANAPARDVVAEVQRAWSADVAAGADSIGEMLLLNANLICSTPVGLAMPREFRAVQPIFDVMIMDEASKATVTDFLVPATRARKWVLVGDHLQLSPYHEDGELRNALEKRIEAINRIPEPEWVESMAAAVRWHHEQRAHPDPRVRQKAWGRMLEEVLAPELAHSFIGEPADEAVWRSRADAWSLGRPAEGDPPELDERSRTMRAPRAKLVADALEIQRVSMPSVFETLREVLPADRVVRLDFQHRMAPALAEFPKAHVYRGEYRSGSRTQSLGLRIPDLEEPGIWIDTGQVAPKQRYEYPRTTGWTGGSYYNPLEVEVVGEVLDRCIRFAQQAWRGKRADGRSAPFEIGVVSFYQVQADRLRQAIFQRYCGDGGRWRRRTNVLAANGADIDVHVSVVDRFQGQEKDVIIISGTRSNPQRRRGHVNNLNRLNVAVTRARHKCIIVGDKQTLVDGTAPGDLLAQLFGCCERKMRWGRVLTSDAGGRR